MQAKRGRGATITEWGHNALRFELCGLRTALAAIVPFLIGQATGHISVGLMILDFLLVIFCILAYSHLPNNYSYFVMYLTPFIVLMINIAAPGNWQIAVVRVFNTVLGGALAVVVAYLLRPRDTPSIAA